MIVVSSRDFREHQKAYLDKVDKGEQLLIQRGKNKSYRLVPVENDDTLMTSDELDAKINRALSQLLEGKARELTPDLQKGLLGL